MPAPKAKKHPCTRHTADPVAFATNVGHEDATRFYVDMIRVEVRCYNCGFVGFVEIGTDTIWAALQKKTKEPEAWSTEALGRAGFKKRKSTPNA